MKYRALVSFSGKITKTKGDIFELSNKEVIKDLLDAKFIEKVKNINKEETVESETERAINED